MRYMLETREKDIEDLVKAAERIGKDLHKVVSTANRELRVSTETERQRRRGDA